MCYEARLSFSKKKRIAKKDIKVIKFALRDISNAKPQPVRPYFYTHTGVVYEEGRRYYSNIEAHNIDNVLSINNGLHSFHKKLVITKKNQDATVTNWFRVEVISLLTLGTETFSTMSSDPDNLLVRMECHIPKGATYFVNLDGEIVSDSLVVDKIIDYKNE